MMERTDRGDGRVSWWRIARLAGHSALRYCRLAGSHTLRQRRDRVGECYALDQGGVYEIFSETVNEGGADDHNAVLIVGFHLRFLRSSPFLHRAFQRLCILTTPIWSGFPGFRVKLWMVDPVTKNYVGIYDWAGAEKAETYARALVRALRPFSARDSVWYALYPGQDLDAFLQTRRREQLVRETAIAAPVAATSSR